MLELRQVGNNMVEVEKEKARVLFSYNTPVAAYVRGVGYIRTEEYFSSTTSRHITKWLAGASAKAVPQSEINDLI